MSQSTQNVYFDISTNGAPAGRIIFKLYDDICPMTSRNFRELATGQHGFGYAGSSIHRIIPQAATSQIGMAPAGARFTDLLFPFCPILVGNVRDRSFVLGMRSDLMTMRFTDPFSSPYTLYVYSHSVPRPMSSCPVRPPDENFVVKHDRPGLLSMANRGPRSNSSQVSAPHHSYSTSPCLITLTFISLHYGPVLHRRCSMHSAPDSSARRVTRPFVRSTFASTDAQRPTHPSSGIMQFFITTSHAPWCDGKNVVFGEVVEGLDIVRSIQTSYASDDMLRRPSVPVVIERCGVC
ncbi:hypothetical protein EW146_g2226 [Bondarzewia mesenterica]|uniref:Peptidyl-prolyl cis-trans isomerase n=1 Tax=Bondarzewia mesenterica TaxID=1095465 RepID=A0A4S4M1H7_9AGAM|nr:hypothetical protein EW146_g2226 [Bondarzewia mesenterica]